MITAFNIRVYGIVIDKDNNVLLTDEIRNGFKMTKFPGGGLEFGEGTIECLKREFQEEMEAEISSVEHFYTTDYFQQSSFKNSDQIISIYYTAQCHGIKEEQIIDNRYNFKLKGEDELLLRWVNIHSIEKEDLSFPIDQKVLELLKNR